MSQWTARPPLRQARAGLGVAKVDHQILAIGGAGPNDAGMIVSLNVVEARRDAGAKTWRDLARMPTARTNLATAEVGGLVYAIGGANADNQALNVVETFDPNPTSGGWATSLPLPQPRAGPAAAALGGLLYVAGGFDADAGEPTNSMVVYDPKHPAWKSVAPMNQRRDKLRLVASGPHLYAIGGTDSDGRSLTTVERYDPVSDSWATMNPMVESRGLPGVVETRVGGRRVLVVVGGAETNAQGDLVSARRTTEVFDPATGQWTLLDILLPIGGRAGHDCATEANGTVLAIGGVNKVGDTVTRLPNVDALSLKPHDLP
jgi:N-acetylneuraminic acid mutarotase